VREFRDESGREWRAWSVEPAEIHPQTKSEDYLSDCYVIGWIVFETRDGKEKRRLCPWPANWASLSDEALRGLLNKADSATPSKLSWADGKLGDANPR
jgi:hypothetical protein